MSDSDSSDSKDGAESESNSSDSSSSSSSFDDLQKAFMAERKRLRRNRVSADGMAILETSSSEDSSPPRIRRRTALPLSDSDDGSSCSCGHEIVCCNQSARTRGQSSEHLEPNMNEPCTSSKAVRRSEMQVTPRVFMGSFISGCAQEPARHLRFGQWWGLHGQMSYLLAGDKIAGSRQSRGM